LRLRLFNASEEAIVSFFLPKLLNNTVAIRWRIEGMKPGVKTETETNVEAIFRGQSRMTSRGQITVPTEIRKKFGLKSGDTLCFLEVDGSIVLKLGPLVLTE